MTNKDILKKQIIYRSTHRGTKEMDLLLGNFTKKNINIFNDSELNDLNNLSQINDEILTKKQDRLFCNILKDKVPKYDLVIVSDYGHGMISKKGANLICKLSKYLALNAQINAANVGYHSMRNYKNINCVIINENEIRHEMRNRNDKLETLMRRLSFKHNIENLIVTKGAQGSILYNKKNKKINYCGAYAKVVVDKIGAGDAMLSIVALCLKCGFDRDLALIIASLAAAQSVETIGNKESINKTQILKTLEKENLTNNTMVVFTSDNGGMLNRGGQDAYAMDHHMNGELLGFKFDAWEGGHRVPFIVKWPGKVEAGSVSNQLISNIDMVATFAALFNRKLQQG